VHDRRDLWGVPRLGAGRRAALGYLLRCGAHPLRARAGSSLLRVCRFLLLDAEDHRADVVRAARPNPFLPILHWREHGVLPDVPTWPRRNAAAHVPLPAVAGM